MLIGGRVTGFASGRLKQWPGSQLKDDLMEWMDHWNGHSRTQLRLKTGRRYSRRHMR